MFFSCSRWVREREKDTETEGGRERERERHRDGGREGEREREGCLLQR